MTHPAQTLPCPACHAPAGQPCRHLTTAGEVPALAGWVHPARARAWRPVAERLRRTGAILRRAR